MAKSQFPFLAKARAIYGRSVGKRGLARTPVLFLSLVTIRGGGAPPLRTPAPFLNKGIMGLGGNGGVHESTRSLHIPTAHEINRIVNAAKKFLEATIQQRSQLNVKASGRKDEEEVASDGRHRASDGLQMGDAHQHLPGGDMPRGPPLKATERLSIPATEWKTLSAEMRASIRPAFFFYPAPGSN